MRVIFLSALIFTIIILFASKLEITSSTAPSLDKFNPKPQKISGIQFPRVGNNMYRGLQLKEYSLEKAILSMLDYSDEYLDSKLLRLIKTKCLKQKIKLNVSEIQKTTEILNKINCGEIKGNLSHELLKIGINYFNEDLKKDSFAKKYLNYYSGEFENHPANLIYSSIHFETASWYSPNVLIFEDYKAKPRSLDLNYYNFVRNKNWLEPNLNKAPDIRDHGEIVTPVFISSNNMLGYEIREKNKKGLYRKLNWGFYKTEYLNQPIVLLLDGQNLNNQPSDAIIKSKNTFYFAKSNSKIADVFSLPSLLSEKPKIKAIIYKIIESSHFENNFNEIFNNYSCSSRKLSKRVLLQLKKTLSSDALKIAYCDS